MPDAEKGVETLKIKAEKDLSAASSFKELEAVYKRYLGRRGELTQILRSIAALSSKERKKRGKEANDARDFLQGIFEKRKNQLETTLYAISRPSKIDVTAPGAKLPKGHLHPLTLVQRKAGEIFQSMGFALAQGPEVETEWYNFDALNIPSSHPARDLWNTFWLKPRSAGLLLRTHTSPAQVRTMESHHPPLRIVVPGRVFRYEATDASHEVNFYQLEGLMVGKEVSVANFKAIIEEFYSRFFAKPAAVRLRPSYFPFTEPSFEIDMRLGASDWLEMMGAGMVHPHVFKAAGYVPGEWQGFAFGMGLDRLAMMKYKIPDIRLLYSGDLRFLRQF